MPCVRASVVPEPCGECKPCCEEREALIAAIVKGMREVNRDPNPGLPILRKTDLMHLRRIYERWADLNEPRYVY